MEQKRTLWIVAAAGIFLLVVVGAALILYSPSLHKNQIQQASFDPSSGWVKVSPSDKTEIQPKGQEDSISSFENPIAFTETEKQESISEKINYTENPFTSENEKGISQIKAENLTVISDNTTVYSTETTTIDLNALKTISSKNDKGRQMREARPQQKQAEPEYDYESFRTQEPAFKDQPKKEIAMQKEPEPVKAEKEAPKTSVAMATAPAPAKAPKESEPAAQKPAAPKTTASKPAAKSAAPKTAAKPAQKIPDSYWIQVASYSSKKNADEARAVLEKNKIPTEIFTADSNGKTMYRVRVGSYITKSEAEYWQSRIAMIDKFADVKSYIVNSSAKTN